LWKTSHFLTYFNKATKYISKNPKNCYFFKEFMIKNSHKKPLFIKKEENFQKLAFQGLKSHIFMEKSEDL